MHSSSECSSGMGMPGRSDATLSRPHDQVVTPAGHRLVRQYPKPGRYRNDQALLYIASATDSQTPMCRCWSRGCGHGTMFALTPKKLMERTFLGFGRASAALNHTGQASALDQDAPNGLCPHRHSCIRALKMWWSARGSITLICGLPHDTVPAHGHLRENQ